MCLIFITPSRIRGCLIFDTPPSEGTDYYHPHPHWCTPGVMEWIPVSVRIPSHQTFSFKHLSNCFTTSYSSTYGWGGGGGLFFLHCPFDIRTGLPIKLDSNDEYFKYFQFQFLFIYQNDLSVGKCCGLWSLTKFLVKNHSSPPTGQNIGRHILFKWGGGDKTFSDQLLTFELSAMGSRKENVNYKQIYQLKICYSQLFSLSVVELWIGND